MSRPALAPLIAALALWPAVLRAETEAPPPRVLSPLERSRFFIQLEFHGSLLSDAPDRSSFAISIGEGARFGYHGERIGAFVQIERSRWRTSERGARLTAGVLNAGLGVDYRYFGGRMRASVAAGSSTLLFDALFDEAGTTGVFIDIRPTALRWDPIDHVGIELDPLSFAWMAPVLRAPRIVRTMYRSGLMMEVRF